MITSNAGGRLVDLARDTGVAVAATLTGKGAVPDDNLLAVGVVGYGDHFQEEIADIRADLAETEFKRLRACDFPVDSWSAFAAGAVGRVAYG